MKKDLRSYVSIFKQEGTSRSERYPRVLNPDNLPIDDRRLEDFIIYAQQYSKNILFVDTDGNAPDLTRSWEEFFKDNLVLLSANIAKKDNKEIKKDYDFLYDQFHKEESVESFSRIVEYVFSRFLKIDQWYASSSTESVLNKELDMYIRSYLSKEFQKLNQIIIYINKLNKDSGKDLSVNTELINKNDIWEVSDKIKISLGSYVFEGKNDRDKLYSALLYTNKIFDTVFHVTSRIIDLSRNFFNEAIYQQQNISPHIALYITFIKLFGYVQDDLNKLPGRLLNFYYRDVLKINPKEATPDKAFMVFELVKGFDFWKVDQGTRLLAGKDKNKKELVYTTDKDIIINKARISSLKTIYIEKKDGLITQYFGDTLKQDEKLLTDPEAAESNSSLKTFGSSEKGKEVKTGFAIASTQLYLAKGERNVIINFETREEITITEWEDFDTSILELMLTGEKGWITSKNQLDGITVNYLRKSGEKNLELNFNISIAQPSAVIAFDPALHQDKFNLHLPVLKIMLHFPPTPKNKEISEEALLKIKQLNFLLSVSILNTTIKVQVGSISEKVSFDGIRDLLLENHDTVLDPKKPFFPFTTMPKVGSSFYIGCNDLFYKKNIENLTLSIDWMLPDNFHSYYDKYFHPYDSNKFTATLSVLRNRQWTNLRDISIIEADTDEPGFRVIKVPNKPRTSPAPVIENDVSKFDVSKKDGTLKLKLKYPDFGHEIYPQLVTSIAMEKASSKRGTVDFYEIIKKELADSEISIKLPAPHDENYRINVVLDILKDPKEKDISKRMINDALNYSLTKYNGVNISVKDIQKMSHDPIRTLVNDDNFIERVLRFLKKVKLIDKHIHFDRDKDTVESIVEDVNNQLNKRIDFILPADEELVSLIISEVNNAIRRIVAKAADKIIESKKTQPFDENTVSGIITNEINDANEVINDMVAKKIAILLSAHEIPPKPYTPLINSISLSYTSVKELNKDEDHFYHILPFGLAETSPFASNTRAEKMQVPTARLFPGTITTLKEKDLNPAGILFIGIKELVPDQNLTMFFKIDQSTKRSGKRPPDINWWYLRNNTWLELENDLLISDSTHGLQTTGIVEISTPHNLSNQNTIFDVSNLYWLCASVTKDTDSFPGLIDIVAQAVTVTFGNNGNDPQHLASPLPANKITRFEEMIPAVKTIRQPDASFNGKIEESEPEFYSRVSERLKHKSRAVNNWDYERLILEQFPFVFKVKCLNNYYQGQFIPGHVTVVPIVNLKNKSAGLQTELPSASFLELKNIEEFLKLKSSPFVKIHAINPLAEYILINCKMKFKADVDKGFYMKKLNDDLIQFLTPWAIDTDAPSYSTKIYSSSIISFLDKKEYVDYVADLSMNQFTIMDDGTFNYSRLENQTISLTETQITAPHSILVSAREHNIELL